MLKRINVILPEATISTIARLVKKGGRSRLIDNAVQHYFATLSAEGFLEPLKRSPISDREFDAEMTADWAAVDKESWQHIDQEDEKDNQEARGRTRGEIYRTSLDPTVGREIKKTQPALVIQNDVANEHGVDDHGRPDHVHRAHVALACPRPHRRG